MDTACKDFNDENGAVDYESDYDCQGDHTATHNKLTDRYTYGFQSTKNKVDSNLVYNYTENTDGTFTGDETVSFKTGTGADYTASSTPSQNDIKSAPYWKDYITGKMKDFRKKQADKEYGEYQAMLDNNAMLANQQALANSEGAAGSDKVKLYVNLVNVTDDANPAANNLWQYKGSSTYDESNLESSVAAKDFVFGYTGILESGETSSLLIKSVEFDENTTQDSFKDLKFDINVLVESAQAVYNGPRVESTAAKAGITVIEPSAADYADSDAIVAWVYDNNPNAVPTDNDPNHKGNTPGQDAYQIAPKKYTREVNGVDVAVPTPVKMDTVTFDGGTTDYEYKVVIDGVTYYGTANTNNTVFSAVNEEGTALADPAKSFTLKVE